MTRDVPSRCRPKARLHAPSITQEEARCLPFGVSAAFGRLPCVASLCAASGLLFSPRVLSVASPLA